jgi:hypothetical protein
MKLTIELDDAELLRLIKQQVSAAVSALSSEYLNNEVDRILAIKFERLDQATVADSIRASVDEAVNSYVKAHLPHGSLRAIFGEAAERLIKEKTK